MNVRFVSTKCCRIIVGAWLLIIGMCTIGCNSRTPPEDASKMLGTHPVTVEGEGTFMAFSSNYTGRIYARTESTSITLLGDRLFVNKCSYGEIEQAASIVVKDGAVSIDGVPVSGSKLTKEEDLELYPWREYRTVFRGFAFVVQWRKDTVVGKVDPLLGHRYLAIGSDNYNIRHNNLLKNGTVLTSLRKGDVIHVEGPTVAIARGGTTVKTLGSQPSTNQAVPEVESE